MIELAMNILEIEGRQISLDADGYLRQLDDWDHVVAEKLAHLEGINLTNEHWEVIELLREFYQTFNLSPAMRPLCKYARLKLGPEKSTSIYLLTLFPGSPPKVGAKIAGLPRPANCL